MSSLDSDGFFNKGVMCDTFKTSGKEPDSKKKLTMLVMEHKKKNSDVASQKKILFSLGGKKKVCKQQKL